MIMIFSILERPVIKSNLHLTLSYYLNSNFTPTLGYLNTALNNLQSWTKLLRKLHIWGHFF